VRAVSREREGQTDDDFGDGLINHEFCDRFHDLRHGLCEDRRARVRVEAEIIADRYADALLTGIQRQETGSKLW
jgi:hypothetical protein